MSRTRLSFASFALASLLAFASCTQRGVVEPFQTGAATLVIRADLSGTAVATVVVEVTAPDIPSQLFNIPIVNHVASGTIALRAGSGRTITMRAYDAGGVETHRGSATIDIQPGTNPTISIVLQPLTGDFGTADDVAQACVYLATAPFVTGAVLSVDGGWTAK